jgi:toxin ParE1/3/4
MTRRYRLAENAKRDLKGIAAFIGKDNKRAAQKIVKRLREVCRTTLVMFPEAGTKCDELLPGMRCFSVGSYVIYFTGRNPVEILRVAHGAMEREEIDFE